MLAICDKRSGSNRKATDAAAAASNRYNFQQLNPLIDCDPHFPAVRRLIQTNYSPNWHGGDSAVRHELASSRASTSDVREIVKLRK